MNREITMTRRLTFLSFLTAGLLASGAAFAAPVNNVGGIGVPLGMDTISQLDYETLITSPTSDFLGVGTVLSISNGNFGYTYNPGNGILLYDEFSGFTVRNITNVDGSGNVLDTTRLSSRFP